MIEKTWSEPPIEYEWSSAGPNKARFCLYPEQYKHSAEDVVVATKWLHENHDVFSLQIRWKKIGDSEAPPVKIPDQAIISVLERKLGELESYILELEDKLQKITQSEENQLNKQLRKDIMSEQIYKFQEKTVSKLRKEIVSLRETNSRLIGQLHQMNIKKEG